MTDLPMLISPRPRPQYLLQHIAHLLRRPRISQRKGRGAGVPRVRPQERVHQLRMFEFQTLIVKVAISITDMAISPDREMACRQK